MNIIVLLLFFLGMAILGFAIMKKLDVFLINNVQSKNDMNSEKNVIRIACDNPIMLTSILEKLETFSREYKEISFYFFTGYRTDIKKMLENESIDLVFLMEDMNIGDKECYGKKVSSFFPQPLTEPITGFTIEPLENQQMNMYVLWKKTHITEEQRMLLPYI